MLAKAWNYLGMYCPYIPETILYRVQTLENASRLYQKAGDGFNSANALTNCAYLNFALGRIVEAKNAAFASYKLQKSLKFMNTHYLTDLLAFIDSKKGNYVEALKYGMESLKTVASTKDELGLPYFFARISDAYLADEYHREQASYWIDKSLNEFLKRGGDPALYHILASKVLLGYKPEPNKGLQKLISKLLKDYPPNNTIDQQAAYLALGSSYEQLKDFALAEKYFILAEQLEAPNLKIRGNATSGYIYHYISAFYLQKKNFQKSKEYIFKYFAQAEKFPPDTILLARSYWELFRIDSAAGNFPAMKNLYKYELLNQKINLRIKNKEIQELYVRYQTMQQQKDLQVVKAKNVLQEQQNASTRQVAIIGLAILVSVLLITLLAYRNKQKSNMQLKKQKQEIDRSNNLLRDLVHEKDELLVSKEWLLKEVHHRVKNNLQLVISLLNSQTAYLKDKQALEAVNESRHRVQAMSLIHQKLYNTENAATIEMREYIINLVDYLRDSFKIELKVLFKYELNPLRLDISQAIPVGLILNELITNALKYAFSYDGNEEIDISLRSSSAKTITLRVADNGRGLPENFDIHTSKSFGLTLIKGLTEDLNGIFAFTNSPGTTFELSFELIELSDNYLQV